MGFTILARCHLYIELGPWNVISPFLGYWNISSIDIIAHIDKQFMYLCACILTPSPWLWICYVLHKNIERHTEDTIVSWPSPKQCVIFHTSDLMMIIRQSIYILSIITREMGKLKTHSPTYCIMDNGENMLNLTHTLEKVYLTGIL